MTPDFLTSPVRETVHRRHDDLLSAGLGLAGLRAPPAAYDDPLHPGAGALRRRAIQASWRGTADLGPLGGYGSLYGAVPDVPGREYQAFAKLPGARAPHRVLLQVPDAFDADARCLVVTASSGSRGVYAGIALAGAWGLPRGCAVAYTDKGAGAGYVDTGDHTGVALDGTRVRAGEALLEFQPESAPAGAGIAVKHAHSGDHPEADWGAHVLQAARFGLAMLDRAFPRQAPFTAANTRIIATGLSNGGGAVLQAAGEDDTGLLDAVVALAPNVHIIGGGRPLYDYATEAALYLPGALADPCFAEAPFARVEGRVPAAWLQRCGSLRDAACIGGASSAAQAARALERLRAGGWEHAALATAASSTAFGLWRAVAATYASAYLRRGVGAMPCGFGFRSVGGDGRPGPADAAVKASWWADASGIPPGDGVMLTADGADRADPGWGGEACLRALWTGDHADAGDLRAAVAATAAALPRHDLPLWVIHGRDDGLLPAAFTSRAYVAWLRRHDRHPLYWEIPHAQHFDAFLTLPAFGARHVPLLPYGYAALDRVLAHLRAGVALRQMTTPQPRPRGDSALTVAALDLPAT